MRIISRITDWITTPYTIFLILKDRTIARSEKIRSILGLVLMTAYIISPVDLVPDFIPMAGILDEFIVIPLWLTFMRKIIPSIAIMEKRERAQASVRKVVVWTTIAMIVFLSLLLIFIGLVVFIIIKLVAGT